MKKFTIRNSAAWIAFRWNSIATADPIEIGANTQNTIWSAVIYSPSRSTGSEPSGGGGCRSCSLVQMASSRESNDSS